MIMISLLPPITHQQSDLSGMQDPESSLLLVPFLREMGSLGQKPITNSTTDCFLIPIFIYI